MNSKPYPNIARKNAVLSLLEFNRWAFEAGMESDLFDIKFWIKHYLIFLNLIKKNYNSHLVLKKY